MASLQDILENEDVKLDNMFIASLVGDIIRVSISWKVCLCVCVFVCVCVSVLLMHTKTTKFAIQCNVLADFITLSVPYICT